MRGLFAASFRVPIGYLWQARSVLCVPCVFLQRMNSYLVAHSGCDFLNMNAASPLSLQRRSAYAQSTHTHFEFRNYMRAERFVTSFG